MLDKNIDMNMDWFPSSPNLKHAQLVQAPSRSLRTIKYSLSFLFSISIF